MPDEAVAAKGVAAAKFRPLIIQALLLPLVAMLVFAAILLWQVSRVSRNQWWVDHTDEVIAAATDLHTGHLRAESAVRGFLITGDSTFQDQFQQEITAIGPEAASLTNLVSDNPAQVDRIKQVDALRGRWLVLIQKELDLRRGGGDWVSIVKAGETRAIMRSINNVFVGFVSVEKGLRKERIDRVQRSFQLAVGITVGLALLIGAGLALLARRQIRFLTATYDHALAEANQAKDMLEERVEQRTAELAMANVEMQRASEALRISNDRLRISNRELQDFASVASHDLQEPLRKVQAFGDRLRVKFAPNLGVEGVDYLDRMLNAASRMKNLINDLLTFARVTSRAQPFVAVDLNEVAEQVLSDLESRIEQTHAKVDLLPLPVIEADVTQMRQLMQNLIGNALKFAKPDQPPHVTISCTQPTQEPQNLVQISVKDDGIGFDEKYVDRIFTVFQRLHGRNEYEGTGIGLAVCRKIAERHRGTIIARSRLGEGAEFIVELPSRQAAGPSIVTPSGDGNDSEFAEAMSA